MKFNITILSCLLLTVLTGCQSGDAKEVLGMKIDAPDEFAVERKPKLEVPPSFKLRPPTPGEAPINVADTRDTAKEEIIGKSTPVVANGPAEKTFLTKVGAEQANPDIRAKLTEEYPASADTSTLEKIRSISDKNVDRTLVDQQKEKARIDANLKTNQPVTAGDTPTKSTQDGKSFLEKIFD